MSLRAVVQYLDYRLKKDAEDQFYKVVTAEHLATLAAGMRTNERIGFLDKVNKIWGIAPVEDKRTAKEIIEDTFKKHGIQIKKEGGV